MRRVQCVVDSVVDHGERVYTVDLKPNRRLPSFRPGQFLHLTVDEHDPAGFWPESRVFSIASSPSERDRLRICYSVKGAYTTKMERALTCGSDVWIKLAYGDFVIDTSKHAVLIAGGTGISAFTAFLESLTPEHQKSVSLLYGAKTPALWLFQDMIASQLARVPSLEAILFSESALPLTSHSDASQRLPTYSHGVIRLDSVSFKNTHQPDSLFYLSGPPAMLQALEAELLARGVPPSQVRTDAWE